MVVISKPLFYKKLGPEVTCRELIHPHFDSCVKANLNLCLGPFVKGIFFFYLPIHLLQVILDYKKINRKRFLKNFLINLLRSQCLGMSFGGLVIGSICLSSNFLGRFTYSNLLFLPGVTAGLSLFWERPKYQYMNTILWASLLIESMIKNAYHFKIMKYSVVRETVIFMFASSLLMHLMAKRNKKQIPFNLWFYRPSDDVTNNFTIYKYFTEIVKYFGFGYGLNCVRYFLNYAPILFKNPKQFLEKTVLNRKNLKFGMVIGTYVALFRGISIFLQKCCKQSSTNAAIAGFVAGIAYYVNPNITILTTAFVTILQILCKPIATNPKLSKVPFKVLIFMICNGFLYHNRLVAPVTCPKYYSNMLNTTSGGVLDVLYGNLMKKYLFNS